MLVSDLVSRSDLPPTMTTSDQDIAREAERMFALAGHPEWSAAVTGGHVLVRLTDQSLAGAAMAAAATVPGVCWVSAAVGAVGSLNPAELR